MPYGHKMKMFTSNAACQKFRWLIILLLLLPSLISGIVDRWQEYSYAVTMELSPDAAGFVHLAQAEPYSYFAGWREPLWPFLLHMTENLSSLDAKQASFLLSFITSVLTIPALFCVVYFSAGLLEATIAAYLLAFSRVHIETLSFAAREDLMLIGLLALLLAFAKKRFCIAFILTGILVHLRVSTLVFSCLLYLSLLGLEYTSRRTWNPLKFLQSYHSRLDWLGMVLGLIIALPVLIYFQLHLGDPLAPQTIAVHEYFYEEKYDKWLTDVTQDFSNAQMPGSNLVLPMLLENDAARLIQSVKTLFLWKMLDYIKTSAVVLLGIGVGFGISMFRRKSQPLVLFFLINTLPLLAISWSEHFRPGLALVPAVSAMAFLAISIGTAARILLDIEPLETQNEEGKE